MRHHSPPIGMHEIQTEPPGFSYTAGGNTRVQPLWKPDWHAPTMDDPAIVLLDFDPKELKVCTHTKSYTWISRAALLITAKSILKDNLDILQQVNG